MSPPPCCPVASATALTCGWTVLGRAQVPNGYGHAFELLRLLGWSGEKKLWDTVLLLTPRVKSADYASERRERSDLDLLREAQPLNFGGSGATRHGTLQQ